MSRDTNPHRRRAATAATLGVAILLVLAWQYSRRHAAPPAHEHIVERREQGFRPDTLTVQPGDTVTFVNASDRSAWPASDLHPLHTDYPGGRFDSGRPLSPGERWNFTFEAAGAWAYHDHLFPSARGVIVVGAGSADPCATENTPRCWHHRVTETFQHEGLRSAFHFMSRLWATDPAFPVFCHRIAHNLGIAVFEKFLADEESVIIPESAFCDAGLYYGIVEMLLASGANTEEAAALCARLGGTLPSFAVMQCFHGLGHNMVTVAVRDGAREPLLDAPLATCETLGGELSRGSCVNGIFEAFLLYRYRDASAPDIFAACAQQQDRYQVRCYGQAAAVLALSGPQNFSTLQSAVERLDDSAAAAQALTLLAANSAMLLGVDQAASTCRESRFRDACLRGFAIGFLARGAPGREYEAAFSFCQSLSGDAAARHACYRFLIESAIPQRFDPHYQRRACESVSPEYRRYCEPR